MEQLEGRCLMAGEIDPGFLNGKVLVGGHGDTPYPAEMKVSGDGRSIAIGSNYYGNEFQLAAYLPTGIKDDSFGASGVANVRLNSSLKEFYYGVSGKSVHLLSNGKILVVGVPTIYDTSIKQRLAVGRLNENGSVDESFGVNGFQFLELLNTTEVTHIANQNDGKIIILTKQTYSNRVNEVYRINSDGTIDGSFGENGRVTVDVSFSSDSSVWPQSDGTLLLASYPLNLNNGALNIELYRFNQYGAVISKTNTEASLLASSDLNSTFVKSVAFSPDGKVIALGGASNQIHDVDPIIERYNLDGSIDKSFGKNGRVRIEDKSSFAKYEKITFDANGEFLAVGGSEVRTATGTLFNPIVHRYRANGSLDPTFVIDTRFNDPIEQTFFTDRTFSEPGFTPNGSLILGVYRFRTAFNSTERFTFGAFRTEDDHTSLAVSDSLAGSFDIGTFVGRLSTSSQDRRNWSYSFADGDGGQNNSLFRLDGENLFSTASAVLDSSYPFSIRLKATSDDGRSHERIIVISNAQVSTDALSLGLSSLLKENVAPGSLIGKLYVDDGKATDLHSYSLVSGIGSSDNASFEIVGNRLKVISEVDFETKAFYSIRVRAVSLEGDILERALQVNVMDGNEAPTDLSVDVALYDNTPAGYGVATLRTVDPNRETSFAYEFVNGEGAEDNSRFVIVRDVIQTKFNIDFETRSTYTVRVRGSDFSGATIERSFVLNVEDRNEPPTDLSLEASVPENTPASTVVGRFSTVDFNTSDSFTYSLVSGAGDTDNTAFSILGDQLLMETPLSFLRQPKVSIRVRTTDSQGAFYEKSFLIDVLDINDPPTSTTLAMHRLWPDAIPEDVILGDLVGTFSSLDQNANERFTYQFVVGAGDVDNAAFSISHNTLRVKGPINYETTSQRSVRVRTTDKEGAYREDVFVIKVKDVAEPLSQPGSLDASFGDRGIVRLNSFTPYPKYYDNGVRVLGSNIIFDNGFNNPPPQNENEDDWFRGIFQADGKIIANSTRTIERYLPNGKIDPTFGDGGRIIPSINVRDIAVDRLGRIIAVGDRYRSASNRTTVAIARYNADGTVDRSFGDNGWQFIARFDERTSFEKLQILVRDNGSIVVAGNVTESIFTPTYSFYGNWRKTSSLLLTQITDAGATDQTFGEFGYVGADSYSFLGRLRTAQDGSLLLSALRNQPVATSSNSNTTTSNGVLRLTPSGAFDLGFGNAGFANADRLIDDFYLQSDGKLRTLSIVRSYNNGAFTNTVATISQFTSDGMLDTLHDTDGHADIELNSLSYDRGYFQPDGKVVMVGGELFSSYFPMISTRLNADLTKDTDYSFTSIQPPYSVSEISRSNLIGSHIFNNDGNMLWMASNSSIVYGSSNFEPEYRAVLMRLSPNGTMDSTLSEYGGIRLSNKNAEDAVAKVLVQSDGRILLVGTFGEAGYGAVGSFGITRLTIDGRVDRTYGTNGRVNQFVEEHSAGFRDALIQPDGKILGIGSVKIGSTWDFAIFRYQPDGSPDTTFDEDGIATFDFDNVDNYATGVAIQDDGRIFVVGASRKPEQNFPTLIRLTPNGKLDTTFNRELNEANDSREETTGDNLKIAMQAGKLLLLRTNYRISNTYFQRAILQRYNMDGSIDRSFNQGGAVVFASESNRPGGDSVNQLQVLSDESIILGGTHYSAGSTFEEQYRGLLVKLNQQGLSDPSFGNNGRFIGSSPIYNLVASPDGKLFSDWRRHNSDGSIDTSFNVAAADVSNNVPNFSIAALAIQKNGDYLVAGKTRYTDARETTIFRINSGIKSPNASADTYSLPANWAVFSSDRDGKASSIKSDDGLLANDEYDRSSTLQLELVQAPQHGELRLHGDGTFNYVPNQTTSPNMSDSFTYRLRDAFGQTSDASVVTFSFTERVAPPQHNKREPADVDQDNEVNPIDILKVINFLRRNGTSVDTRNLATIPNFMCDVNGDMYVSPIDILMVINKLNRRVIATSVQPEGEWSVDSLFANMADLDDVLEKRKKATVRA